MTTHFIETADGLEFHHERGVPLRLVLAIFATIFLAISGLASMTVFKALIERTPPSDNEALAAFFMVSFFGFGSVIFWEAVVTPSYSLLFNRNDETITCIALALIPWHRERQFSFRSVSNIEIVKCNPGDTESPDWYKLQLTLVSQERIGVGRFSYDEQEQVNDRLKQIRRLLGLP